MKHHLTGEIINTICCIYYLVHKLNAGINLKSTHIQMYLKKKKMVLTVLENNTDNIFYNIYLNLPTLLSY